MSENPRKNFPIPEVLEPVPERPGTVDLKAFLDAEIYGKFPQEQVLIAAERSGKTRKAVLQELMSAEVVQSSDFIIRENIDWFLEKIPKAEMEDILFSTRDGVEVLLNLLATKKEVFSHVDHEKIANKALEFGMEYELISEIEHLNLENQDAVAKKAMQKLSFQYALSGEGYRHVDPNVFAEVAVENGREKNFLDEGAAKELELRPELVKALADWADNDGKYVQGSYGVAESNLQKIVWNTVLRMAETEPGESGDPEAINAAVDFYNSIPEIIPRNPSIDLVLYKGMLQIDNPDLEEGQKPVPGELVRASPEVYAVAMLASSQYKKFGFWKTQEGRDVVEKIIERGKNVAVLRMLRRSELESKNGFAPELNKSAGLESKRMMLHAALAADPRALMPGRKNAHTIKRGPSMDFVGDWIKDLPEGEREKFIEDWLETDPLGALTAHEYYKSGDYYNGVPDTKNSFILTPELLNENVLQHGFELTPEQVNAAIEKGIRQIDPWRLLVAGDEQYQPFCDLILSEGHIDKTLHQYADEYPDAIESYDVRFAHTKSPELHKRRMELVFRNSLDYGTLTVENAMRQMGGEQGYFAQDVPLEAVNEGIDKQLKKGDLAELRRELVSYARARVGGYKADLPKPTHPWVNIISRLESLQKPSARADKDPWQKNLPALTKFAFKGENEKGKKVTEPFFDASSEKDGEILLDFVKTFGMVKTPMLFEAFVHAKRAEKVEDIPEAVQGRMRAFMGNRRFENLTTPDALVRELSRSLRVMQTYLLDEKVPYGLGTELGDELLITIRGSHNWEQNDNMAEVAQTWRATAEKNPELAKIPAGYKEVVLSVHKRAEQTIESKVEQEERAREVIEDRSLISKVGRTLHGAVDHRFYHHEQQRWVADGVVEEEDASTEKLPSIVYAKEHISQLQRKLDRLDKRINHVEDPRQVTGMKISREKIQQEVDAMLELVMGIATHSHIEVNKEEDLSGWIDLLKKASEFDIKKPAIRRIITSISLSVVRVIKPERFNSYTAIAGPSTDAFYGFSESNIRETNTFLQEYLFEHFLHPKQDPEHTGHPPFSEELLKVLNRVWERPKPGEKDMLGDAVRKLDAIARGAVLGETTDLTMVPNKGMLRVLSGDTGDACFTNKHKQLAKGEYPDLTSYTYVANRGTDRESIVGSTLFIEAKTPSGEGVLNVRANNPRENYLQSVDGEDLVLKTLEEAIAVAKRRGLDRVTIPLDPASASSSNRPGVAEAYEKRFGRNELTQLVESPETDFNGYDNYNKHGNHPVVTIWQKGVGKIGDWPS